MKQSRVTGYKTDSHIQWEVLWDRIIEALFPLLPSPHSLGTSQSLPESGHIHGLPWEGWRKTGNWNFGPLDRGSGSQGSGNADFNINVDSWTYLGPSASWPLRDHYPKAAPMHT